MSEETKDVVVEEIVTDVAEKPHFKRELAKYRRCVYKICKQCGKMFVMADNDVVHYAKTYGQIPMRCPECREKKRAYFDSVADAEVKEGE